MIKDGDLFVKNVGCFFRSLASNLNSIADKEKFIEHLSSSAFLRRVLDCATCDESFLKSCCLLQVFNKIFQEIQKIQSSGEEKELRENLNDFLSDDEKDEVILDQNQSPFKSEYHIDIYIEFLPKILRLFETHSCNHFCNPLTKQTKSLIWKSYSSFKFCLASTQPK